MCMDKRTRSARAVTQWEIAHRCGVNQATVSLALRGDPRVKQETLKRVLEVAAELGYDPAIHDMARRLVSRRHGTQMLNRLVALLLPPYFYRATYFARIVQGIMDEMTRARFTLVIHYNRLPNAEDDALLQLPPIFHCGGVDGVIAYAGPPSFDALRDQLQKCAGFARNPVVSLLGPAADCCSVVTDDRQGAYRSATHLLDLGHRHLLQFCYCAGRSTIIDRLSGVELAMRERGLDPAKYLHRYDLPNGWLHPAPPEPRPTQLPDHAGGEQPLVAYLRANPEITGILAHNDFNALRIRDTLRDACWRVPEDYSLVGFNDETDLGYDTAAHNQLTTVRLPLEDIGQQAARLLLEQVTDLQPRQEECLTLPTEFVVRGTTTSAR